MRISNNHSRGYTVAEMLVATGVLMLLGLVFFQVLQTGLILFSKNTAVNISHEQARQGLNRMVRDIHAAVSVPELRLLDITTTPISLPTPSPSPTPVSGTAVGPMFAAVSFQNIANGPNYIWKDPPSAQIMIQDNYNVTAGQHLLIPFWGALFEQDITQASAWGSANHSNIKLVNGADTQINPRDLNSGAYAITYYTERMAYAVINGTFYQDSQNGIYTTAGQWSAHSSNYVWVPPNSRGTDVPPGHLFSYKNGELHVFRQRYSGGAFYWQDFGVVARNLTSAMPFYTPLNTGGGFNTKYVGIQITTGDPKSSNRGYLATNMILNTTVDYRTALALTQ